MALYSSLDYSQRSVYKDWKMGNNFVLMYFDFNGLTEYAMCNKSMIRCTILDGKSLHIPIQFISCWTLAKSECRWPSLDLIEQKLNYIKITI